MTSTMMISMWIMNSVAAAMMIPIVDAVFENLEKLEKQSEARIPLKILDGSKSVTAQNIKMKENPMDLRPRKDSRIMSYKKCVLLSVAYGANIGGTGTMTASSPNIVFSQIVNMMYGSKTGMSYASWSMFGIPTMILCGLLTCCLLQLIFMGFQSTENTQEEAAIARIALENEYKKMGRLTFHEVGVMMSFALLVLLYFFRRPHFMSGWETTLQPSKKVTDAVPTVLVVILMCVLPARPLEALRNNSKRVEALIDWNVIQNKIPWDLILLQGCGYALAAGFKESDLNAWLGTKLMALQTFPTGVLCYAVAMLTSFATEVASNASTSAVLVPIVGSMAEKLHVHPIYFMLPVAMSSSYSFMLPIATGPNALVFKSGKMKSKDMLYVGFLTNCLCVTILCFMINTLGVVVYGLDTFPDWALPPLSNSSLAGNVTDTRM